MEKNVLIIDNENQSAEIEGIIRKGKNKGVTINCYQFNVGATFREDLLNEFKSIDLNKVIDSFTTDFKGIPFNLIAFDWNLSDDKVNGVELIRQFQAKDIRKNTPKLLYSGVLKEQIASMLNEFKDGKQKETTIVSWLNSLIRIPIVDFVDRPIYAETIVSLMEKSSDTLENRIEAELRKLSDFKFNGVFPYFTGKSFGEIADIIEKDNELGNIFKAELINQLVSYLTQINLD